MKKEKAMRKSLMGGKLVMDGTGGPLIENGTILMYENHDLGRQFLIKLEILLGRSWNDKSTKGHIVNATFLIAGETQITIPVSCVEQGRWAYRSQKFASGEKVMAPSMRLKNQKAVAMNLKEGFGSGDDLEWIGIEGRTHEGTFILFFLL
jgi:hypothetical protein